MNIYILGTFKSYYIRIFVMFKIHVLFYFFMSAYQFHIEKTIHLYILLIYMLILAI